MFGNHFFDIPFDKEILVNKGHITDDLPHINRRGQSNQSLNGFAVVILTQVPHQVVPPEAGPHHIDRRVRVVVLDSVQGGLELAMLAGGKGYRAGHLVVDPTAVQADWFITLVRGLGHQRLDVVHLWPPGKAVHDEQDWWVRVVQLLSAPVKRNVPSVLEKYPLPVKLVCLQWLWDVVYRLQKRMCQVRSRFVPWCVLGLGLQQRANDITFWKQLRKVSDFHTELFYTIVKNCDWFIVHLRQWGTILQSLLVMVFWSVKNISNFTNYVDKTPFLTYFSLRLIISSESAVKNHPLTVYTFGDPKILVKNIIGEAQNGHTKGRKEY